MINSIHGLVEVVSNNSITVLNNGIEYILTVSTACVSQIENQGTYKVYTYLNVSEQDISLYGFLELKEREMFLLLIKVNGIGPKGAIKILSSADIEQVAGAILSEDELELSKINGVGKKTAQRIILSLKENKALLGFENKENAKSGAKKSTKLNSDIIDGLVSMGFDKKKVIATLKSLPDGLSDQDLLKSAIINLSK